MSGTPYKIVDEDTYRTEVSLALADSIDEVRVYREPTEAEDYHLLDVVVEDDEVLLHESSYAAGSGRYHALKENVVTELIASGALVEQ